MRFLGTLLVLAVIVCVLGWLFETDFLLFDILLILGLLVLQIIIPLILLIIAIWVLLELFR